MAPILQAQGLCQGVPSSDSEQIFQPSSRWLPAGCTPSSSFRATQHFSSSPSALAPFLPPGTFWTLRKEAPCRAIEGRSMSSHLPPQPYHLASLLLSLSQPCHSQTLPGKAERSSQTPAHTGQFPHLLFSVPCFQSPWSLHLSPLISPVMGVWPPSFRGD